MTSASNVVRNAVAFHRSFASVPLRGQAFAVFRGPVGDRSGRLLVTTDVRLPEGGGMEVAVLPVRAAPTPPGESEALADGTTVAIGDGLFALRRPRAPGVLAGEDLVELGRRAAALAVQRGW